MPNFLYTDDTPFATNNPSTDQPDMKTNTNSIDGIISVDHVGFNDPNGGWHTVIHQQQAPGNIDPVAVPATGQLYVKTGTDQQLFFESGAGVVTNLTNPALQFTSISGTINITAALQDLVIIANDCIGMLVVQSTQTFPNTKFAWTFGFFAVSGTVYIQQPEAFTGTAPNVSILVSSKAAFPTTFQISRSTGVDYNAAWKIIYWPV